jgi:hypothetical protein
VTDPARFRAIGEAGWRWVLDQVRYDDAGPWIPEYGDGGPPSAAYRFGTHSGTGGLALALGAVATTRDWTGEEAALAAAIGDQLVARAATAGDATFFDGLSGAVHALLALGRSPRPALDRLHAIGTDAGWPQLSTAGPTVAPGTPFLDLTLGTAGVLDAAVAGGDVALATRAAELLAAEAQPRPDGLAWLMVADELRLVPRRAEMPNLSHGTAGAALALASAGSFLGRPDLVDLARRGAEHLVAIRDRSVDGLAIPHLLVSPGIDPADVHDGERLTWGWCHGPAGTSLLFAALDRAGVASVAGRPPAAWRADCLRAVRNSGVPDRLRPGFWDNDGRCCGTAGVGEVFLDAGDRDFAVRLGDALVDRAVVDGQRACWRFVEHRSPDPLLPPGVGWMQGAAGIAAYLLRLAAAL